MVSGRRVRSKVFRVRLPSRSSSAASVAAGVTASAGPRTRYSGPFPWRLSSVVARCRLGPSRTQDQPSSRFPRLTQVRSGFSLRSCSRRCRRRAPSPMGRAISQRVPRPSYSACALQRISQRARSWPRLGARAAWLEFKTTQAMGAPASPRQVSRVAANHCPAKPSCWDSVRLCRGAITHDTGVRSAHRGRLQAAAQALSG